MLKIKNHKHKLGDSVELDISKFEDSVNDEKFAQDYVKELQVKLNATMGEGSIWLTDWIKDSDTSSRIEGYGIMKAEQPSEKYNNIETAKRDKALFEEHFKRSIPSDVKYEITDVQERWPQGFNKENRWVDFVLTIPVGKWSQSKPEAKVVNIDELYISKVMSEDSKTSKALDAIKSFKDSKKVKDSLSEEDHDRFVHELFGSMEPVLRKYSKLGMSLGDIQVACEFILNHLDGADIKLVEDSLPESTKGEKIALLMAEQFKGECGPAGGENPKLSGNKLGLYSQMPTEWFKFNNDGSVDAENLRELLEAYPEDYGVEGEEDIEAMVKENGHFASVKDLLNSDFSWFMYIDNKEEVLKKVDEILKSDVNDSKVKDADDSEIEEIVHLLGEAHDKVIEAQDVVDSLVSDDELPDDVQWELDDLEAATSELDFMGEGNPVQSFKDHFGIDESSDEEDY